MDLTHFNGDIVKPPLEYRRRRIWEINVESIQRN
jgi:hypothetical protein